MQNKERLRKTWSLDTSAWVVVIAVLVGAAGFIVWQHALDADPALPRPPAVVIPNPNGYGLYVAASRTAVEPPMTAGIFELGVVRPTQADISPL
jgi:hypothetical protein